MQNGWKLDLAFPLGGRAEKPRTTGLTMVIDKGLGMSATRDLLQVAGLYIDFVKLSFGTSALYTPEVLQEKIALIKAYGVDVYPGGTFLEVAVVQNRLEQYLVRAKELGFTCIEVSDGTIELPQNTRRAAIAHAREMGFKVLTEVGKKDGEAVFDAPEMVKLMKDDLDHGAHWVIIEGRESGTVGIYDSKGETSRINMEIIMRGAPSPDVIIWEAPQKKQQVELIRTLGNNVNLGNIATDEALALECLRHGLRGDTFLDALRNRNPLFS